MTTQSSSERFWAGVPTIDDAPAEAGSAIPRSRPSSAGRARFRPSRRTMLKSAGLLGGALALNVLTWLPPAKQRSAGATVGTEYRNCGGYDEWDGYDNNSALCVGAPYSRNYCGSDGWFLHTSGTCFSSGPAIACGDRIAKKNAWRWTHRGTPYRCADGFQQWCGGSHFVICSWSNPTPR